MERQKNKPKERIKVGRISLVKWENSNGNGEVFNSFSLNKTLMKRNQEDPSKFEGRVFSLNGITISELEAIKEAIEKMQQRMKSQGCAQ